MGLVNTHGRGPRGLDRWASIRYTPGAPRRAPVEPTRSRTTTPAGRAQRQDARSGRRGPQRNAAVARPASSGAPEPRGRRRPWALPRPRRPLQTESLWRPAARHRTRTHALAAARPAPPVCPGPRRPTILGPTRRGCGPCGTCADTSTKCRGRRRRRCRRIRRPRAHASWHRASHRANVSGNGPLTNRSGKATARPPAAAAVVTSVSQSTVYVHISTPVKPRTSHPVQGNVFSG